MARTVINYLVLTTVIACSFLAIYTFEFYPTEPYDESLDKFRLFTPGVLFSFFIVFVERLNWRVGKLILLFLLLVMLYFACLIAGLSSWGIAVPLAGGSGAALIRKLFNRKAELLDRTGTKYLLLGFIAGVAGLILYWLFQDVWTNGVGFGFILVTWQLVFGLLWIMQTERIPIGTSLQNLPPPSR